MLLDPTKPFVLSSRRRDLLNKLAIMAAQVSGQGEFTGAGATMAGSSSSADEQGIGVKTLKDGKDYKDGKDAQENFAPADLERGMLTHATANAGGIPPSVSETTQEPATPSASTRPAVFLISPPIV